MMSSLLVVVLHACQIKSLLLILILLSMEMCVCVLYRNRNRERVEKESVQKWMSVLFAQKSVENLFLRV